MKVVYLVVILTGLALGACRPPESEAMITAVPTEFLPTSIALTVQARTTPGTPTPTGLVQPNPSPGPTDSTLPAIASPTATSLLGELIPTATASPTLPATATPTPTSVSDIPLAEIEITAPGALSKVISPIPVRALLVPGDQGRVTVELLGEDGRVLTRQIVILNPDLGRKAGLVIDLPFEIPAEAELGRLVIYRQDEFGRTTALSSVELVLIASGQADYNPVLSTIAPIVIQQPLPEILIQGGTVIVSGLARPSTSFDLVAELITETGQVVGQRVFDVDDPGSLSHTPFTVEITYTVDEPIWVLLIIRERGERIPGITYITSTEVLLSP